MARPVTLFTGQWADLPLAELAPKAKAFGFRSVNPKERTAEHERQLREFYIANVHAGSRKTLEPLQKALADLKKKQD